jgi:OFA family oxalate/formate antiporter-like MFS transporter
LTLLVGAVVLLFAGVIYAWSVLKAPLASEFGWDAARLSVNYTLTVSFFCLGSVLSGLISQKTGPRLRLMIGAVCLFAGFFVTSRLSADDVVLLYLAYGVVAGLGIGFAYNTVISAISAWFPDKKGLCSGVLMMTFGFSALFIGRVATVMIEAPAIGWRATFLLLAIIAGAVLFVSAFFVRFPPKDVVFLSAKPSTKSISAAKGRGPATEEAEDYTAPEMLRCASFWVTYLFLILILGVGSVSIAFAKDLFIAVGANQGFAVTMVGMLSLCNGLGRLVSGMIFDRVGIRVTQFVLSVLAILSPLLVSFALALGSLKLGVAGLCLCGFTYGFCPTVTVAFSSAFYGSKNFSLNFGILSSALIPSSFSAAIAGSVIAATGSFSPVFIALVGCSVAALLLGIFIKRPRRT